jgi:hypothetical protein
MALCFSVLLINIIIWLRWCILFQNGT